MASRAATALRGRRRRRSWTLDAIVPPEQRMHPSDQGRPRPSCYPTRCLFMFSIISAADFFQKVKEDLLAFQERIADPGRALNCVLSSYHLHEWVWARLLKPNPPIDLHGTLVRNKKDFIIWLEKNCPHFVLLQDLANGTKHCSPVRSTDRIAGYGRGPYGIGPFGAAYLLVDLGEDYPASERYLVASEVLTQVVQFWDKFFSDFSVSEDGG